MVSSTFQDLREHRAEVLDALFRIGCFPIGMERDSAKGDSDLIASSMSMVDMSVAYIALISHRYGQTPKNAKLNSKRKSLTELEYYRALERKIPVYVFLMSQEHKVTADEVEQDPAKRTKLENFKKYARKRSVTAEFRSVAELKSLVLQSLSAMLATAPASNVEGKYEVPGRPPHPPEFYPVVDYVPGHDFVGRKRELETLDTWSRSDSTMFLCEAIGGMGKSNLCWKWVKSRAREARPDFSGVVWYSFYEGGADMTDFVAHALAYVTGSTVESLRGAKITDLGPKLLAALKRRPYLIVLDGLERILVAYHRLDAPQVLDDKVGLDREHRECIKPEDEEFLRKLVAAAPSKVLITTRLVPTILANSAGLVLPGIFHERLGGLDDEDAVLMARAVGVRGEQTRIAGYLRERFGNHPLLVGIIAGLVCDYRRAPCNFGAWADDAYAGAELKLGKLEIKQRRTHILAAALRGLSRDLLSLLSRIAALSGAVPYETVVALSPYLSIESPLLDEIETEKEESAAKELKSLLRTKIRAIRDPRLNMPWRSRLRDVAELRRQRNNFYSSKNWFQAIEIGLALAAEETFEECDAAAIARAYDSMGDFRYSELWRNIAREMSLNEGLEKREKGTRRRDGAYVPDILSLVEALRELEKRGLLHWDRAKNTYDLHPVVRGYAFDILEGGERKEICGKIADYFQSKPRRDVYSTATSLVDLHESIDLFRVLVFSGRLDQALRFYQRGLGLALFYSLEARRELLALLRPLFQGDFRNPAKIDALNDRCSVMNDAALALAGIGRLDDAEDLFGRVLSLIVDEPSAMREVRAVLSNLADVYFSRHELIRATSTLELAEKVASVVGGADSARAHLALAAVYTEIGRFDQARIKLNLFRWLPQPAERNIYRSGDADLVAVKLDLFQGLCEPNRFEKAFRSALPDNNRSVIRTLYSLEGHFHLKKRNGGAAHDSFSQAIEMSRVAGIPHEDAEAGLAHAKALLGDRTTAISILERLQTAEVSRAEAHFALGDREAAARLIVQAYAIAWADGPPYALAWELERARTILRALEMPEPIMAVRDLSSIESPPYAKEIAALVEKAQSLDILPFPK